MTAFVFFDGAGPERYFREKALKFFNICFAKFQKVLTTAKGDLCGKFKFTF
jgi:hypothetical protein